MLVQEFGEDTEQWINKDVNVILSKKIIAGKKAIVPYLVTKEWQIDEYGELYKTNSNTQKTDFQKEVEPMVEGIPFK